MRKYLILFFFTSLFLFACKTNKNTKGILSHDIMISLMTDVHIIDGRLYNVPQAPDSLFKYGTQYYQDVFKKYHTDSVQMRKSITYYATQPTEFLEIYDKILLNLKKKTDSLNKLQLQKTNAISPQ